jgi:hypothetical protein
VLRPTLGGGTGRGARAKWARQDQCWGDELGDELFNTGRRLLGATLGTPLRPATRAGARSSAGQALDRCSARTGTSAGVELGVALGPALGADWAHLGDTKHWRDSLGPSLGDTLGTLGDALRTPGWRWASAG